MKKFLIAAAVAALSTGSAHAAQIVLSPASVIGTSGSYAGITGPNQFAAGNIFDNQTGTVSEPTQSGYWLNPDNGATNPFITFDLGGLYALTSVTLFDTHNSTYNDRGTGDFSIVGSNSASFTTFTTVAAGTLAATISSQDPISGQSFNAVGTYRYLRFLPTTAATSQTPCCSPTNFGLNELRVFGTAAVAVPEPATWAMMIGGFGLAGAAMRRRRSTKVAFA